MQLLVITIDDCDEFLATLEGLRAHGMNGIVFQSTSLKHALLNSNVDAPPIFGRVSKIMSHDFESSHTAFLLLNDDQLEHAKRVIRRNTHGLGKKGVMFTLPVLSLLLVPGEYRVPRALLLGAIAAATAPAATLLVVRQYKAKGPVTDTLLPVTAFDDAVGLMIFSLCFALAQAFASGDALTVQAIVLDPLREIGLSLLTGGVMGAVLAFVMRFFKSKANRLCLMLAAVFACVALSEMWELSSLLTCMMLGAVFANMRSDSVIAMELCEGWTPALFMLFFVLSGAELDFSILLTVGIPGVIYIIARSAGKYFGAFTGAAMSHADPKVRKYLGITLLPQAGVAIGMAQMVAASDLPQTLSAQVVTVALFATLVYELAGPVLTKLALAKAGEISTENLGKKKKTAAAVESTADAPQA